MTERFSPLGVPPDYERRALDIAKRALEDIPETREAKFSIRWTDGCLPVLVIAFENLPTLIGHPALGIALMTVQQGTLNDIMPGKTLLEGDRLRDRVLYCVTDYLEKHGIRVIVPEHLEHLARPLIVN